MLPRAAHRVIALTLLGVTAGTLTSCSAEADAADDGTAQACRLAAVTYASLDGPRRDMASGGADRDGAQAYQVGLAAYGSAVTGEDEVDPVVLTAITDLVSATSRSQTYVADTTDADVYRPSRAEGFAASEERAYEALQEACPVVE